MKGEVIQSASQVKLDHSSSSAFVTGVVSSNDVGLSYKKSKKSFAARKI